MYTLKIRDGRVQGMYSRGFELDDGRESRACASLLTGDREDGHDDEQCSGLRRRWLPAMVRDYKTPAFLECARRSRPAPRGTPEKW